MNYKEQVKVSFDDNVFKCIILLVRLLLRLAAHSVCLRLLLLLLVHFTLWGKKIGAQSSIRECQD